MLEVQDVRGLRAAIEWAAESRRAGDPPFGSILVDGGGAVVAGDRNTTISDDDVTAHPELKLARWAGRNLSAEQARASTLYTSCYPCPMCANVIRRARIGRVVYALAPD